MAAAWLSFTLSATSSLATRACVGTVETGRGAWWREGARTEVRRPSASTVLPRTRLLTERHTLAARLRHMSGRVHQGSDDQGVTLLPWVPRQVCWSMAHCTYTNLNIFTSLNKRSILLQTAGHSVLDTTQTATDKSWDSSKMQQLTGNKP